MGADGHDPSVPDHPTLDELRQTMPDPADLGDARVWAARIRRAMGWPDRTADPTVDGPSA